jgi:hypothetical protein
MSPILGSLVVKISGVVGEAVSRDWAMQTRIQK